MLPAKWLKSFLDSRGLQSPDGRMLFAYRLTNNDYQTLCDSLRFISSLYDLSSIAKVSGFSAAFVLFASEWWRREYQGGDWTWTPIIEAFDGCPDSLPPNERSECVRKGLQYWGHQPQDEGMRFFGSIVVQGGLPVNLLVQQNGVIFELLKKTIYLAGEYRWTEKLIFQHIFSQNNKLPKTLRIDAICELLTQMVTTALAFRLEFKRTNFTDPIKFFETEPDWRMRFPLSLCNSKAEELIRALLKEATKIDPIKNALINVQRLLKKQQDDSFEIYSQVYLPKNTDSKLVASFFQLPHEELPRYFSIDLLTTDKTLLTHGRQLLGATTSTVAFTDSFRQCHGLSALCEHRAQLRSEYSDINGVDIPLPGGGEIELNALWVFVKRQDIFTLVACGSVRLPDEEAFVSLPNDQWLLENTTDSTVERINDIHVNGTIRSLYRIQGEICASFSSEKFRILTSQPVEDIGSYVWFGSRLIFDSTPKALFLGIPKLYKYNSDGEHERIPDSKLVWRKVGSLNPIKDLSSLKGHVEVRFIEGDDVLARYRLVILPKDAKISFVSGDNESQGEIVFENWEIDNYSIDEEGVSYTFSKHGKMVRLKLNATSKPPEAVNLKLHCLGDSQNLSIKLPFPSTGGRFFDADGKELEQDACLTADELPGLRLRVFDRNPDKPCKYETRLILRDPLNPRGIPGMDSRYPLRLGKSGEIELRLIDFFKEIEILLGFSRHLDAYVEISLFVSGQSVKRVRVRRYDADIIEDDNQLILTAKGGRKILKTELAGVGLCALPLRSLDSHAILLEQSESQGVATGAWSISQLDEALSPWFLYPTSDSNIKFRPMIFGYTYKEDEESLEDIEDVNITTLSEAIALEENDLRIKVINLLLDQMASDFNHASWSTIEALWKNLSHLPLSSLDTWRVLSGNMKAFTAMLFKLGMTGVELRSLVMRFQTELGMVVELATLPMWRSAVTKYKKSLDMQYSNTPQVIPILLKARIDAITEAAPSISILMDVMRYEQLNICTDQILKILSSVKHDQYHFSKELYHGGDALIQKILLRVHFEDTNWPNSNLFKEGLKELYLISNNRIQKLIEKYLRNLFWSGSDVVSEAANVPVLCALWVVISADQKWWTEERRLELQRIRVFDSVWFEQAFSHGLAFGIANQFYGK